MPQPNHILIFRFSALGDVAMTVPVVKTLLEQHPQLHVTMVSSPFMHPLFDNIERLTFFGADTKKDYKGMIGLWRLSRHLKSNFKFDAVADLHDVLRTKILRLFLAPSRLAVIDKGRSEKKELTRPTNKKLRQLKTTFQRYADVFNRIGLPVVIDNTTPLKIALKPTTGRGNYIIGMAPFARHQPKMYPLEKMKQVIELLQHHPNIEIKLFGSKAEATVLAEWEKEFSRVQSLAGKLSFADELQIISTLTLMVSMDSANMHLASMQNVPVVSIWGGTHPFLGFYGWRQSMDNAIQIDLACRPSSVFGNKECPVHGAAGCMQDITPQMIYEKVISQIPQGA